MQAHGPSHVLRVIIDRCEHLTSQMVDAKKNAATAAATTGPSSSSSAKASASAAKAEAEANSAMSAIRAHRLRTLYVVNHCLQYNTV